MKNKQHYYKSFYYKKIKEVDFLLSLIRLINFNQSINNNTNIFEQEIVGRDDYHIWCCCKINTPISCGLQPNKITLLILNNC